MSHVNPPPQIRIPKKVFQDPELRPLFESLRNILFQLWNRTGGANDWFDFDRDDNQLVRADATSGGFQTSTAEVDDAGNMTVNGDMGISGDEIVTGNQAIGGNSSIVGDQDVGGDLGVIGGADIGGALSVDGAVDLNLTLNVDGETTLQDVLKVALQAYIGGITDPTALLHLAAGTAVAGGAPLKFSNGTRLATPEAGAMEYEDGHFYLTDVQGARKAINVVTDVVTSTTTVTNTVTETTIFTKTFVADELHGDMCIDLFLSGSVSNASASDDFSFNIKVAGSTVHTLARVGGNVTNAGWRIHYQLTIRSTGAGGTFIDFGEYAESSISPVSSAEATTHSVDTTGTVALEVTITWAAAKAGNTLSATQGYLEYNH